MTEKDLQELIRIRMGIDAIRKQVIDNLDAMAARVDILLPSDTTPMQKLTKAEIIAISNKMKTEGVHSGNYE